MRLAAGLAVAVAVAVLVLFVALGVPPGHSAALNLSWSRHFTEALSWSAPYPRHLPGLWAGFGGNDFFFYAPLPFWLVAVLVAPLCAGCGAETEFVLGAALFLALSGLTCHAFLRSFFSPGAAAVGALVYVILPYHLLLDWVARQAVGEFAAFAFLPLVALGVERLRRGRGGGLALSLGVAGTALSHLPTALLAAHVFAILCLFLILGGNGPARHRVTLFALVVWRAGLGLMLAALYWLPAIVLLDRVSPDLLFTPYFEPWNWLFGAGTDPLGEGFVAGVVICLVGAAPILLAALVHARGATLVWIVVPIAVALGLNLWLAEPIWRHWIISKVQFPWRLMIFVDLATSVAAATLVACAVGRAGRLTLMAVAIAAAIPYALLSRSIDLVGPPHPATGGGITWIGAMEYLSPETVEAVLRRLGQAEITYFDMVPVARTMAEMAGDFRAAGLGGEVIDRGVRSITLRPQPGQDVLSAPVLYWDLWRAEGPDGAPLRLRANESYGTIDIQAPEGGFGGGPVTLRLARHWSEWTGLGLSCVALILLAIGWRRGRATGQMAGPAADG